MLLSSVNYTVMASSLMLGIEAMLCILFILRLYGAFYYSAFLLFNYFFLHRKL